MTVPDLTLNTVHGDAPRELLAISTGPPLAERATYGRTHCSLVKSPIPDTRVALSPSCARPATPAILRVQSGHFSQIEVGELLKKTFSDYGSNGESATMRVCAAKAVTGYDAQITQATTTSGHLAVPAGR